MTTIEKLEAIIAHEKLALDASSATWDAADAAYKGESRRYNGHVTAMNAFTGKDVVGLRRIAFGIASILLAASILSYLCRGTDAGSIALIVALGMTANLVLCVCVTQKLWIYRRLARAAVRVSPVALFDLAAPSTWESICDSDWGWVMWRTE